MGNGSKKNHRGFPKYVSLSMSQPTNFRLFSRNFCIQMFQQVHSNSSILEQLQISSDCEKCISKLVFSWSKIMGIQISGVPLAIDLEPVGLALQLDSPWPFINVPMNYFIPPDEKPCLGGKLDCCTL